MFTVWFCNGKLSPIASSLSFPILSLSVDVVQWPACRKLQTWWCSRREKRSATWEYSYSYIYVLTSGWKMGNMMRGAIAKNDKVNPDNDDSSLKGKIIKVTLFVFFFNCSTHICIIVTSVFKKCGIISCPCAQHQRLLTEMLQYAQLEMLRYCRLQSYRRHLTKTVHQQYSLRIGLGHFLVFVQIMMSV